jgi:3-oxoacyl-[acyl-carrier protein] reductase
MNERVAVVTGGASGLGWAISQSLASDGLDVVILDKSNDAHGRAAELVRLGGRASAVIADLADTDAIPMMASRILDDKGRCDVLVNNAGTHIRKNDGHRFEFEEVRLQEWNLSIALHMTAPLLLSQAFLPGMKKRRWGRVINISSRAGRTYLTQASVFYAASKAGLIGLTRSIAGEYGPYGVTCNAIAPGRIRTPMSDLSASDTHGFSLAELRVGRIGESSEIGAAVSYLAAESSGFITGVVLDINGGSFMG